MKRIQLLIALPSILLLCVSVLLTGCASEVTDDPPLTPPDNIEEIIDALNHAKAISEKPVCVIANTIPGKGVKFMEGKYEWHGKPPKAEEAKKKAAEEKKAADEAKAAAQSSEVPSAPSGEAEKPAETEAENTANQEESSAAEAKPAQSKPAPTRKPAASRA